MEGTACWGVRGADTGSIINNGARDPVDWTKRHRETAVHDDRVCICKMGSQSQWRRVNLVNTFRLFTHSDDCFLHAIADRTWNTAVLYAYGVHSNGSGEWKCPSRTLVLLEAGLLPTITSRIFLQIYIKHRCNVYYANFDLHGKGFTTHSRKPTITLENQFVYHVVRGERRINKQNQKNKK
jgi:hypothetical protein